MKLAAPEPCLFVIFGARGDLARRKLIPALCRVLAPEERRQRVHILGVGTPTDISHEDVSRPRPRRPSRCRRS